MRVIWVSCRWISSPFSKDLRKVSRRCQKKVTSVTTVSKTKTKKTKEKSSPCKGVIRVSRGCQDATDTPEQKSLSREDVIRVPSRVP